MIAIHRAAPFTALVLTAALSWLPAKESCGEPHALTSLERIRGLTYADRNGEKLLTDVYMPPGEGPFPGVLMVHGGAWAVGSKWHMLFHANQLAQHGFTVVAINYRLAPKHKFPAQLEDCRDALQWMRANAKKYRIDANRLGAYGYSAGGHLVSLLAVTQPAAGKDGTLGQARLRAVVAGGAPCNFDWIDPESRNLAYFLGGSRAEKPAVYRNASPVSFASPQAPPFFFFHGEKDRVVPHSSSDSLHRSLLKSGVDSSYYIVPAQGHLTTFHDSVARDNAITFLNRTLKNAKAKGPKAKGPKATGPKAKGPKAKGPKAKGPKATGSKAADSKAKDLAPK